MPIADLALLRYAGLLAQRPHSAETLRAILCDYFGVPVTVAQFVGTWHALEPDEACSLGSGTANSRLGTGALAGDAVWTGQDLVGVAFGPLNAEQFRRFLPDGEDFEEAAALIRWYLGNALDFEIQAVLRREEVPTCQLGGDDPRAWDGQRGSRQTVLVACDRCCFPGKRASHIGGLIWR